MNILRVVAALRRDRNWRSIKDISLDSLQVASARKMTETYLRQLMDWGVVEALHFPNTTMYRLPIDAETNDHYASFLPFLESLGW